MSEQLLARILRTAGVPELLDVLADRLEPTDLQSLQLEVYRRLAKKVSPAALLKTYEENRFARPSPIDPRKLVELDRLAWSLLPEGYSPIELSPVCPLGTSSAVASVDQNKIVSTSRNTEVVADSTNVMALECAVRRRALRADPKRRHQPVLLASAHRLMRAQALKGPKLFAHFRILSLCSAGRDEGAYKFETSRLLEHLAFYVELLEKHYQPAGTLEGVRVALTDLTPNERLKDLLEQRVMVPLRSRFASVSCHLYPERTSGRGYYRDVCFKLYATTAGSELEIGDGGMTGWTQDLISDKKERLLISGFGVERLLV